MRGTVCLILAASLAGCVSTSATSLTSSASTGAVATSEPLMLNTGPAPGSAPVVAVDKTDAPTADVAPASEPVPGTVTSTATTTIVDTPPPGQPATAAAATSPPVSTDDSITAGFPNVNAPPQQPGGKLLSPEERAKMIAELEALKQRQHGPSTADTSVAPAKCADKNVAATDPDCKPPPTN